MGRRRRRVVTTEKGERETKFPGEEKTMSCNCSPPLQLQLELPCIISFQSYPTNQEIMRKYFFLKFGKSLRKAIQNFRLPVYLQVSKIIFPHYKKSPFPVGRVFRLSLCLRPSPNCPFFRIPACSPPMRRDDRREGKKNSQAVTRNYRVIASYSQLQ